MDLFMFGHRGTKDVGGKKDVYIPTENDDYDEWLETAPTVAFKRGQAAPTEKNE